MKSSHKNGFTLIEALIVAALMLVLAGMAVPTFQNTVADARMASTQQELLRVRTAIDYYAFQHQEQLPGFDGQQWSESAFRNQLLLATDEQGAFAAPGTPNFPYGPYLTEGIPSNPYNSLDSILVFGSSTEFVGPDDSSGWIWFTSDGVFKANTAQETPDGNSVFDL
ncbi:MAG: type II secretion system protein [Planctomycetota bacterium]|jgi:prepilin-type N-terminal cleavage/methylation domain-containing protein|nr:type II secretion system protein [Planctomycetota bacterium]MDP6941660.1 type II secretion system protein [Planctomycetota bacterium]